jgi:hypothetical protein
MSEDAAAIERIVDGESWNDFCDALKAAGSVVLSDSAPNDPLTRAEGWRYLTRLTRGALESFVEASDPEAPEFRRAAHETLKMGMDNPDNIYLSAPIRGTFRYRIHGTRGTVHYLGFGTQKGNYGATGTLHTTGYLEASDLKLSADGSFEIIASATREGENWLPMEPESSSLIVRQTRLDHANEIPAQISIERIGGDNQPQQLDPTRMDRALRNATRFVTGCATLFSNWAEGFEKHTNTLPRFDPQVATVAGGDPNIAYYHSYWKLAPDEALVIEVTPPKCDYWNFQLANHWLESLDYRYFPVHLNQFTAQTRDDGSVRVVVSRENPGVANWLDTCGRDHGTMCWRWIRASSHPEPQVRVVKLAEVTRE